MRAERVNAMRMNFPILCNCADIGSTENLSKSFYFYTVSELGLLQPWTSIYLLNSIDIRPGDTRSTHGLRTMN